MTDKTGDDVVIEKSSIGDGEITINGERYFIVHAGASGRCWSDDRVYLSRGDTFDEAVENIRGDKKFGFDANGASFETHKQHTEGFIQSRDGLFLLAHDYWER